MGLSLLSHGIVPSLHFSPRRPRLGDGRRFAVGVPHTSLNPISTAARSSNFVSFITATRPEPSKYIASAAPSAGAPVIQTQSPLSGSTLTLRTLFSLTIASSVLLAKHAQNLALRNLAAIQSLRGSLSPVAGTLFFAARDQPVGYLNTPLTVVAAGLAKWLDIYSAVLMVRVLLSWFPNIPWDRQPLSAIRDLCDPYLNLFRNIIPPIFDTLDVSPLLAFAVLGTLGGILSNTRGL